MYCITGRLESSRNYKMYFVVMHLGQIGCPEQALALGYLRPLAQVLGHQPLQSIPTYPHHYHNLGDIGIRVEISV